MSNYISIDKLKWDNTFLDIVDESFFRDELKIDKLKNNEFHSNSLNVLNNNIIESVKVSIFSYNEDNNLQIIIDKFKGIFELWMMDYHIIQIGSIKYLISKDMDDIYTQIKLKNKIGRGYIKEMQKIIIFQWIFCIKCSNEDRTLSRCYPAPPNETLGLDFSFIVSCFEHTYIPSMKINFPRTMINKWFNKRDEYFISGAQHMLRDAKDENLFIQKLRDIIMENKGDITWINFISNRIRYILSMQPLNTHLYWATDNIIIPDS